MSSTFAYPSQLFDKSGDRMQAPRNGSPPESQSHINADTPDYQHLSPSSSAAHTHSNSASPSLNNTNTPAESISSVHYQSSDLSEFDDGDPFFGVDFNAIDGGTPSFLDDPSLQLDAVDSMPHALGDPYMTPGRADDVLNGPSYHPLSPEQTPSLPTASPHAERRGVATQPSPDLTFSEEPFRARKQMPSALSIPGTYQLTPETNGSGPSSEDGAPPVLPMQSPRVTVSMWSRENGAPALNFTSDAFSTDPDSPATVRGAMSMDDALDPLSVMTTSRDEQGKWRPNAATGHGGLDPSNRPSGEIASANEMATRRQLRERRSNVDLWLSEHAEKSLDIDAKPETVPEAQGVSDKEISLGHQTENTMQSGRTYFAGEGGPITQEDEDIMRQNRNWNDAPVLFPISHVDSLRHQPETSAAAMQKFENMCRDTDSIVSRAATWGTRRRSLPSIADMEGITSGNFLKKLSISRGDPRRPSIVQQLRRVVRKQPSATLLKRSRSNQDEEGSSGPESGEDNRRDSKSTLAPPTRTMSWGKKQQVPSLNTALVSMGGSVASIASTHVRKTSVGTSHSPPVSSPKSPFALKVRDLRRPRSRSELPKSSTDVPHSNLADMMKKIGGPPVASLAKPSASVFDQDDDDDDDDEMFEDSELKDESTKLIDDITPNFAGFQQHVLQLNPLLESNGNSYLVDRIAHQQSIRYKGLLNARVKHINHVQNRNCPCGPLCIALGGSANILESKSDLRGGLDPLSAARYDGSDGDITPLEGAIAAESFPQDIPMPPTQTLPAEFECQLCYQSKKFQKPSDWTKHVHEDVQPFTCTWDRCRDPKIFKRKADWVRHENEGHRHLEWWTCDVDDCRHTCYRRDNFLQHLVREHKFPEPKVKTKAAIKRAGGVDPTWQKVEKCHTETLVRPQEEPCRFCGKCFPTWKKLTVHLAKHMEQISLPILRLVARKELEADTLISPVHDPPPRTFAPLPVKREPGLSLSPNLPGQGMAHGMAYHPQPPQGQFGFTMGHAPFQQQPIYGMQYGGLSGHHMPNIDAAAIDVPHQHQVAPVFDSFPNMAVSAGGYVEMPHTQYGMAVPPNLEAFPPMPMHGQQLNALGLQEAAVAAAAQGHPMSGYEGMMDAASANGEQHYTPQGSVSPYSHSPHQPPQQQFYGS